jgi:hypothetical protein
MRTPHVLDLVAIAVAAALSTGCSKNAAATSACSASPDLESCNSCCLANGANGYKYTGASTCACLGGSGSATASPGAARATNFAGTYNSTWGKSVFTQTSSAVNVKYARGTMTCTAAGNALDCTWREGATSGKAKLVKETSGAIRGTWGNGASATDGGSWVFRP